MFRSAPDTKYKLRFSPALARRICRTGTLAASLAATPILADAVTYSGTIGDRVMVLELTQPGDGAVAVAARQALLIELPCQIGAYSQTAVYLLADQYGKVSEVVFPSPRISVTYVSEGSTTLDGIVIIETPEVREVSIPAMTPTAAL